MWSTVNGKVVWHDPRPETKNCYDEVYLEDDRRIMANMFEHCTDHAYRLWKIRLNRDKYLNAFMNSYCREVMDLGHPALSSQASINTMEDFIEGEYNGDETPFKLDRYKRNPYAPSDAYYWIGTIYAQLHFILDMKSKDLIALFPLEEAKIHYKLGHELGINEYCARVAPLIKSGRYKAG